MSLKSLNSIEEIYHGKEVFELKGKFICPVCKKEYIRQKAAETHMADQDCYDIKSLIQNTEREKIAHKLYVSMMVEIAPNARVSMTHFRKNRMYSLVAKFTLFCSLYEVKMSELYYAWIRDVMGFKHANAVLSNGAKHQVLSNFRIWLREHPEFIESDKFISRYDGLTNPDSDEYDPHFVIRSIEKSHLSIGYFLDYYGLTGQTIPTHDLEQEYRVAELMKYIK